MVTVDPQPRGLARAITGERQLEENRPVSTTHLREVGSAAVAGRLDDAVDVAVAPLGSGGHLGVVRSVGRTAQARVTGDVCLPESTAVLHGREHGSRRRSARLVAHGVERAVRRIERSVSTTCNTAVGARRCGE